MKPNYVAKKSIVPTLSFWLIIFSWLIIPLIVQIFRIILAKFYSIEFYDEKIIVRSGVLNIVERQFVFAGVYSVGSYQTIFGRIFNYADVNVDCPGRWDIDTKGIKNAFALKSYLETKITSKGMTNIINN